MATNINKKKESNLLLLKKNSNYFSSTQELNQISFNFHQKNGSKTGRLYNHCNNITKISNYQSKNFEHTTIINNYIKNSSPTVNNKTSNIDISNSNGNDINKNIKGNNYSNKEYPKDLQYKKQFHHKKINSHLLIKNNPILNELFLSNTSANINKAKDSLFKNKKKNASKILRKKNIQIDTFNINNNTNVNNNNTTKKIINSLSNNNNNQHKINLKIYLEKHSRVLSTDNNISINSKNQKYEKKNNINSVIKSNRLITNKHNSKRLLNNLNCKANTLSRANSSWIKKEINIFNNSLEYSFSKNKNNKINNKTKINNVIVKDRNNFIKEKKLKINDNSENKKNDLLHFNKLKEKTTLYYLTNISEELKTKKKNYHNGNNIFISINNYANDNKKKSNKNVNLTEGKEINIHNYLSKKSISHKGANTMRRNYLKKNNNKYKILSGYKFWSENKTEENLNSYMSDNDKVEKIDCPEITHFFIVASIQKGIKNTISYN